MRKDKVFLVVDSNISKDNFWLKNELENNGFYVYYIGQISYTLKDITIKWRKILLWLKYIITALYYSHYEKNPYIISIAQHSNECTD